MAEEVAADAVNTGGRSAPPNLRTFVKNLMVPAVRQNFATALLPYEPIEFVGEPIVPAVLQRALMKAEEDLPEV